MIPQLHFKYIYSWKKMKATENLSLKIDKNTLVSVDTPLNEIGDIEFNVTPWMTPITDISVVEATRGEDIKVKMNKASTRLPNIIGTARNILLKVRFYVTL